MIKIAAILTFITLEIDGYQRLMPYHAGEFLIANFLLCLVGLWFAWEIVEA
jgi:hypothetical protein